MAGILHDIGRLVLHVADPARAAAAAENDDGSLERELFGISHPEIGAYVAQEWGLDDAIVEAILTHHHPTDEFAARIAEAERLAADIVAGAGCPRTGVSDPAGAERAAVADLALARFRTERALFE